jgi:ActR/RegA family two-component response regulator
LSGRVRTLVGSVAIGEEEAGVVDVEQWAEIRRLPRVARLSIREISRRTGWHRKTIRRALATVDPPRYSRSQTVSTLDPFKD